MTDSKYFSTTKKGEVYELKADLIQPKLERKKDAVKKIIAVMTVGKDVSMLFPDVINCMQTDNLELKKLVYLYLMNYAKNQPDTAIMAINTFVKDCDDPNPLIRALAVRTMGCIRVEKITEYLCEPLRKCMKDTDPYVRKTAAVCVAKLYDMNPTLVEDQGFLQLLCDLMSDSNPMVVANAVASLTEITDMSPHVSEYFEMNSATINKLLAALDECTEWGQIFILDAIANYIPKDKNEVKSICERITHRLSHANSAVVLSAVKVLMKLMEMITNEAALMENIMKKLSPPLVTLLSSEPEVQYVALRNINVIIQKRADILKNEIKSFFVKYNDPIYVKLEKLDIMIRLVTPQNIVQVLAELKEYATEVDVDFVRKSVRAIGRCSIKIEQYAENCVKTLLDLINNKVNYVIQEAIVVLKDIFRRYPNKYETIIATLCENLDSLDEPEAKAAMIWVIGEYAERIDNADELLETFLVSFHDENAQVQLQLLTAIVKLFLKRPADTQNLVQQVLSMATQDSDNPDLRDRGYIYWRLLSTDPSAAKEVVLAEKPLISDETDLIESSLLDELINHIASLASVYHRPPNAFVTGKKSIRKTTLPMRTKADCVDAVTQEPLFLQLSDDNDAAQESIASDFVSEPNSTQPPNVLLGDLLDIEPISNSVQPPTIAAQQSSTQDEDLLGLGLNPLNETDPTTHDSGYSTSSSSIITESPCNGINSLSVLNSDYHHRIEDLFSKLNCSFPDCNGYTAPQQTWLTAAKGKGLEIKGTFARRQCQMFLDLTFTNRAMQPMKGFAIQFNKNSFGIAPTILQIQSPLPPNQTANTLLKLTTSGLVLKMDPINNLQIAVKNNIDVFYFSCFVPANVLLTEDGKMERKLFLSTWKDIPDDKEVKKSLETTVILCDEIPKVLEANNIFIVAHRTVEGQEMFYQSMKFSNDIIVLAELNIVPGNPVMQLSLKTRVQGVVKMVQSIYETLL